MLTTHPHRDDTEGGDAWAIRSGYVSVTPLSLRSCVPSQHSRALFDAANAEVLQATSSVITTAAADMELAAGGVSKL